MFGVLVVAGVVLWNTPSAFMAVGRPLAHWWYGVRERSITVDGHAWPYLEAGAADAPTVVLLHGYGTSMDAMMIVMEWLRRDHHVIAPDLPGFGQHEAHVDQPHDGALYARETLRFMDALGIESASLVGTSMGGAVAAEIAITAPARVERLVLLAPAGLVPPIRNDFMRSADLGENPLRLENEADFDRVVELVFYRPPFVPTPVRRHFVSQAQARLKETNRIIETLKPFVMSGLEDRLGSITAPTLVLWGSYDRVLDPSLLPRFARHIPGSRAMLIVDAGHVLFYDAPEDVRREVVPFLKR